MCVYNICLTLRPKCNTYFKISFFNDLSVLKILVNTMAIDKFSFPHLTFTYIYICDKQTWLY